MKWLIITDVNVEKIFKQNAHWGRATNLDYYLMEYFDSVHMFNTN